MRGVSPEEAVLVSEYKASAATKPWLTAGAVASCVVGLVVPPLLLIGIGLGISSGLAGRRMEKLHFCIASLRLLPAPERLAPGSFISLQPHSEGRAWSHLVGSVTAVGDDHLSGEAEILSEPLGYEKSVRLYWQGSVPVARGQFVEFASVDGTFCIVGVLGSNPIPGLAPGDAGAIQRLEDVVAARKRVIQSMGELRQAHDARSSGREPDTPNDRGVER